MKRNIILFVILSVVAFTACVDEVHIDQDFHETQKLVLYCRLCPQLDTTYILLPRITGFDSALENSEYVTVSELATDTATFFRR